MKKFIALFILSSSYIAASININFGNNSNSHQTISCTSSVSLVSKDLIRLTQELETLTTCTPKERSSWFNNAVAILQPYLSSHFQAPEWYECTKKTYLNHMTCSTDPIIHCIAKNHAILGIIIQHSEDEYIVITKKYPTHYTLITLPTSYNHNELINMCNYMSATRNSSLVQRSLYQMWYFPEHVIAPVCASICLTSLVCSYSSLLSTKENFCITTAAVAMNAFIIHKLFKKSRWYKPIPE